MGCYGASVITALTAQNTLGVQAIHAPPPQFVEQQACLAFASGFRFFTTNKMDA